MTDTPSASKPNPDELIKAAVDYWARFVETPTISTDRGFSGEGAALHLLAQSMTLPASPSADKVQEFKRILTGKLKELSDRGVRQTVTSTDYGPEGDLSDALSEAGVSGGFLLKDSVYIDFERGTVQQDQVRGRSSTLFPKPPEREEGPAAARVNERRGGNSDRSPA